MSPTHTSHPRPNPEADIVLVREELVRRHDWDGGLSDGAIDDAIEVARHRIGGRRLSRTHVAADILGTDWEFLLGDPPGMWAELQTIHDAGFEFGENAPGETYADKWQHCIEASSLGQKFPKLVVRLDAKYAGELGMVPVIRMWASTGA